MKKIAIIVTLVIFVGLLIRPPKVSPPLPTTPGIEQLLNGSVSGCKEPEQYSPTELQTLKKTLEAAQSISLATGKPIPPQSLDYLCRFYPDISP